jgi:single-strand DNA-binding protein
MASFNRVIIIGNLTRDPEYKQLTSGQAVCRLGLATNRQFKNKQSGSMVQEVCYIDIDVWGAQADSCKQYLQKGRSVLIEGRLKLDSWDDAQGQKRSKHSIVADRVVFLGAGGGAETGAEFGAEADEQSGGNSSARVAPQDPMEQELFSKIETIKNRKKAAPKAATNAEVDFKDEPPFQDDLPF